MKPPSFGRTYSRGSLRGCFFLSKQSGRSCGKKEWKMKKKNKKKWRKKKRGGIERENYEKGIGDDWWRRTEGLFRDSVTIMLPAFNHISWWRHTIIVYGCIHLVTLDSTCQRCHIIYPRACMFMYRYVYIYLFYKHAYMAADN